MFLNLIYFFFFKEIYDVYYKLMLTYDLKLNFEFVFKINKNCKNYHKVIK